MKWISLCVCLFVCLSVVKADTPANCTYEDIQGSWTFFITEQVYDKSVNCSGSLDYTTQYKVNLNFPDVAADEQGNLGYWTMIYNQGFEVVINDRKFFAFSYYKKDVFKDVESICDKTFPGWVHSLNERNWGCYYGQKNEMGTSQQKKIVKHPITLKYTVDLERRKFRNSKQFIADINNIQSQWRAEDHTHFHDKSVSEVIRMAGGRRSARAFPTTATITKTQQKAAEILPKEFDWRNRDGENFVSPIRNQEACGSCYAFGSLALHEARLRIVTNNTVQKVFSTQDIVSCSEYSQGCDGGFPYLIAGKYGQDFGLVEEECFKYEARDAPCKQTTCQRYYTDKYYYIGGFYGACNEPLMRAELVKNGPIAVSFEVYKDFTAYKGGIYSHTGIEDKFNPWEITNHVVLVVGYGEENGTPYWIVKNSWGPEWGEDGFFRIRRNTDECSIESMAVGTIPVV